MNKKNFGSALVLLTLSTAVYSGTMGVISAERMFQPIIGVQGGYAALGGADATTTFVGTDDDLFIYRPSSTTRNTGFVGAFAGLEFKVPQYLPEGYFLQAGAEYNYFGSNSIKGINEVGVESGTVTVYDYQYTNQSQQVLGTVRLLGTTHTRFHPYGEVGLGAAFNQSSHYRATTAQTGSVDLTPIYSGEDYTDFSYAVGLGVDVDLSSHFRAGLGYRYTNFGCGSLGDGAVVFNQYRAPVTFNPAGSHLDANLLIARLNYLA